MQVLSTAENASRSVLQDHPDEDLAYLPGAALRGSTDLVDLAELVRSVAALDVDGRLCLSHDSWWGEMFVHGGRLVEAVCGADRGQHALDAICQLAAPSDTVIRFTFWPEGLDGVEGGEEDLGAYFGRAAREARMIHTLVAAGGDVPRVMPYDPELGEDDTVLLDRRTLALLVDVDGRRSVAQLAHLHGELPTLKGLVRLIDAGVLAVPPTHAATRTGIRSQPRQSPWSSATPRIVQVGSWTLVSAFVGFACWVAPGTAITLLGALSLGVPITYVLWQRPELGVLLLLGLTAGLLRARDLYVPLPLGGLFPADVALVGLFALFGVRAVMRDGLRIVWRPVTGPLLVFLILCGFSVGSAVALRGLELRQALNELRPVAFYAVAIVTTLAITNARQVTALLVGLFVLADIIVVALVLQQFAGEGSRLLPGMDDWQVNDMGGTGSMPPGIGAAPQGFGLTRIVPPAVLLLFFMSIYAFVRSLTSRGLARVAFCLEFVLLNTGLLLTYTRAQWIASVISVGICIPLLPRAARARLSRSLPALLLLVLLAFTAFEAGVEPPGGVGPFLSAVLSRATSTFATEQTLNSSSLQWRVFETGAALQSIKEAPLGVGLGNIYRPVTTLAGEAVGYQGTEPLNRFVHNSYLYIAVKTGVPGLAAFLWFCVAFVGNSWRLVRRLPDGTPRWLALAGMASFVGIMQWSFTEANFMQTGSTVVVGVLVGVVASSVRATSTPDRALAEAA